jgi:exodeoxyribonuclease VII large subunit
MVDYASTTIAEIQSAVTNGMQKLEEKIGNVRFIGDVTISKQQNWGVVFDASSAGDKLKCVWFQRNAQLKDRTVYVICGKSQYTPYGMQIKVHSVVEDTETTTQTQQLLMLCNDKSWFVNKKGVDFLKYKRLGILSKKGSKGYEDFITQLRMPCERVLVEISLEGPKTESDIINGIAELTKQRVDCIMIIRGGGDFLDMSNSYDRAAIFQAVVDSKVPVISAIGHSNDDLIINRVCDFHTETPTTLACFIRGQWRDVIQQTYNAQRKSALDHLTFSYVHARRKITERVQYMRDETRVQFETLKKSVIKTICPYPIFDMSDIATIGKEHTIAVKLKDGTYHRACIQMTSDPIAAGDLDLDSIHRAEVEGLGIRSNHPQLATIQATYNELHETSLQWCDRPFGGDSMPQMDDELLGSLENQVALLEHYKTQLESTDVQQCTLDILEISISQTDATSGCDLPEMISHVRKLRYLVQTYGD